MKAFGHILLLVLIAHVCLGQTTSQPKAVHSLTNLSDSAWRSISAARAKKPFVVLTLTNDVSQDSVLAVTDRINANDTARLVIARLRKTKLFDAVDYVDRLPSPPVVLARWNRTPYGTATIPVVSLLTFGIIPTTVHEPLSFGCSFYSARHPEQQVEVEYRYDSHTTLGWVAAVLALSPNVVIVPWQPDEHRRFYQHLSLAILDRSEEIVRLTE